MSVFERGPHHAPPPDANPPTGSELSIDLPGNAGVSGLPVIDRPGALVGILTGGDLLRRVEPGSQCHLPRSIQYLFRGTVALSGGIADARARGAVHAAIRNGPGVVALRDRRTWREPRSGSVLSSRDDATAGDTGAAATGILRRPPNGGPEIEDALR